MREAALQAPSRANGAKQHCSSLQGPKVLSSATGSYERRRRVFEFDFFVSLIFYKEDGMDGWIGCVDRTGYTKSPFLFYNTLSSYIPKYIIVCPDKFLVVCPDAKTQNHPLELIFFS